MKNFHLRGFPMALDKYATLMTVVEAGSLTRAAEQLGCTQSAVSHCLDTLESELGFTVLRRSRAGVMLTDDKIPDQPGSRNLPDAFRRHQFQLFDKASRQLQSVYSHKILRHICNSAAIEHFPEYQLDMVRLGLGLYGINPRNNQILNNVATLRTTILQIRDVKAGDSIGYSRRTILTRDSRIAAIPIGYADGLNRRLGNRNCYCLVNGKKAEYVGNICMDVCMIDVTDIECKVGDYAIIFGDDLPITVLSDAIGTIPYEVLTGISTRVGRVYVQQ